MNTSITIQLNTYSSKLSELAKRMKKDTRESLRVAYQALEDEYIRLMQYVAMPRLSDEEMNKLTIY